MRNWHGLRSPFGSWHSGDRGFNPRTLFGPTDIGWFYDLSDMSTLFQDAAGTTPVTAFGQPMGLCLDKSKGLVLGPERLANAAPAVTGTATAASYNTSTGAGNCTRVDAANQSWVQFSGLTTGAHRVAITNTGAVALFIRAGVGIGAVTYAVLPLASLTATFVATSGAFSVTCDVGTASFVVNSVRELPGNHRSQSASLPRPTYARHPLGGIRNLLTFTEQFDNAAWSGGGFPTRTANAGIAPNATNTADRVAWTTAGGQFIGSSNITNIPGVAYTGSLYVKPLSTAGNIAVQIGRGDSAQLARVVFNAGDNTVNLNASGADVTGGSVSVSSVGDGWFRVSVTATFASSYVNGFTLLIAANTANGDYLIWGAQLELGSTATAYQRVVSVFDVTEAGQPDLYYLAYDGSDDCLSTAPFAWGSDKATVVAGVRKLADPPDGFVVEFSPSVSAGNNNAFYLAAPGTSLSILRSYGFVSRGTLQPGAFPTGNPLPAPNSSVLTAIGDISGDRATLRVNGAQFAQNLGDQGGSGPYGTYPAFFGARGGTSLFFNGREYSQFAINRLLTPNELSQIERYTAQKTGVTI